MQRLFSSFPDGRPGLALALVRISVGVMLFDGVAPWARALGGRVYVAALGIVCVALCVGVLTPLMCALVVAVEASIVAMAQGDIHAVHLCAALSAISLSILGPGAYSVDARLFGRRRLVIRDGRTGREPPGPP